MEPDPRYALFQVGGWFDQTFDRRLQGRFMTWRTALSLFVHAGGTTIVETGCQRMADDWGAGCSTHIFARLLAKLKRGTLHSVDNSETHLSKAREIVTGDGTGDRVKFHLSDSVAYLQGFDATIDLLYLDSLDYSATEPAVSACQKHQLREIQAGMEKLAVGAIVVLDDNALPQGGKTRLAKEFLARQNWKCVLDWQQSVWIR